MKEPNVEKMAEHYAAIISEIGGDLKSEGMRDTPMRAAKALVEMTEGSRMGTERLTTMFEAECHQAVCHGNRWACTSSDGRLSSMSTMAISTQS